MTEITKTSDLYTRVAEKTGAPRALVKQLAIPLMYGAYDLSEETLEERLIRVVRMATWEKK